jgi:hypothetical protein
MIKKDFLCMCASQTHYKMHQNINMNKFQMYHHQHQQVGAWG